MHKPSETNVQRTFLFCIFYFVFCITLLSCNHQLPPPEQLPQQEELPDPLVMMDGTPVRTADDWYQKRRPELKRLFQHYVYGYLPEPPPIKYTIVKTDSTLFENRAIYREVDIELLLPRAKTHHILLSLFIPGSGDQKHPVFIFLNKCGNHTVSEFEGISVVERPWIHQSCRDDYPKRGSRADYWAVRNSVERGYAIATFHCADMDPDTLNWDDGIHARYPNPPGDENSRWATLAAWAWGIHRVVDYLETDSSMDSHKICLTGWSRRGKAALFAAAMDERIDLVIPHQSGTGGMALSRMKPEESIERINTVFPHWFNGNFKKFNQNESRLPLDQHLLVALVAPRPLMDNAGLQDTWASPHLALEALKAASPVYELLGEKGVIGDGFVSDTLGNVKMGKLLQYRRDTEHTINEDYWNAMLDFADRQLP